MEVYLYIRPVIIFSLSLPCSHCLFSFLLALWWAFAHLAYSFSLFNWPSLYCYLFLTVPLAVFVSSLSLCLSQASPLASSSHARLARLSSPHFPVAQRHVLPSKRDRDCDLWYIYATRIEFYGNFYHTYCSNLVFYGHSADFATLVYTLTMRVVIYDILRMAIIPTLSTSILFCNLCYILLWISPRSVVKIAIRI